MNVEEYIVARVNALTHRTDAAIVKRLEGGMSNYTYVVSTDGKKYTYRVPGKFAEKFVDRVDEWDNIQKINPLKINSETLYLEIPSGEKLAAYVEGTIMSETDIVSYNAMSAAALRQLHESKVQMKPYDAFGRLAQYEGYCCDNGYEHPAEYLALRAMLDEMRAQYAQVPQVPCHCDYQPTNLVIAGSKLYILDWEYAGMNDPIYDIACYGNAGFDKALALLPVYLGHEPTRDELRRLYFHRAFQCIQWYNVAIFKDRIGLSKDLNMDFNQVALMFQGMATDLVNSYDSI